MKKMHKFKDLLVMAHAPTRIRRQSGSSLKQVLMVSVLSLAVLCAFFVPAMAASNLGNLNAQCTLAAPCNVGSVPVGATTNFSVRLSTVEAPPLLLASRSYRATQLLP